MITAFVQARMTSSRLPGKALLPLAGRPMLARVVERVRACRQVDKIVVVTGQDATNDPIRAWCAAAQVSVYSGHDDDVLDRFMCASALFGTAEYYLRITADCPVVDPDLLSALIEQSETKGVDVSAILTGATTGEVGHRWPDGLDAELISPRALLWAFAYARTPWEREHVTRVLWARRPFPWWLLTAPQELGHFRWTVDTEVDYDQVARIYERLGAAGQLFGWQDVLRAEANA